MKAASPSLIQLADSIGDFIQYWGFRKIHGKVWTLIYLSSTPVGNCELIEFTGVSKGLMSTTIATLLDYGLIQVVETGNKKTKAYTANLNIGPVIASVLEQREKNLLIKIKENFESVLADPPEWLDQKKLNRLKRYIKFASSMLQAVIKFGSFSFAEWKALEKNPRP